MRHSVLRDHAFCDAARGLAARYFGVAGFEWSFEIAGTAFVWVTFLGAAIAELRQENVAFDAVAAKAGPLIATILAGVKAGAILCTGLMLLVSSVAVLRQSGGVPTPVLHWPAATMSASIAVFALIACAIGVLRFKDGVRSGLDRRAAANDRKRS